MTDRRFINHHNLNQRGNIVTVDCRFCRLIEKYDKYAHVAPCGCAGSTRYVHRQCLVRWIVVKFQHVYNHPHNGDPQQFNIFCEVCQQRMEMEYVVTNKLSKYEDFIENIIARKILFSTLLLLAAGLLVGIIILSVYSSNMAANIPPNLIFGLSFCCVGIVVVIIIFICKFMMMKTIQVEYISNNKNPMIMGFQANIDSVDEEEEGSEKDPYFGVKETKKDPQIDKSLMLQSKRDSGSVVSKTLTDLVMQKMYKHDEVSLKGKSQKQFDQSKYNKVSRYSKREPVRQMRDQEVQISDLQRRQQQIQITKFSKGDKSIQKGVNQLDQEIQFSHHIKNQSIQLSNNNKDVSVQPSFQAPKMKRIFKEDTSVPPASSFADRIEKKSPKPPKKIDKLFISQYEEKFEPEMEYKKPTPLEPENHSSGDSKKSEQQFEKQVKPKRDVSPDAKLRLKTIKDPIKIRVMF